MTQRIGNVVFIEPEGDSRCELCGEMAETRPYGPNGERVCYECGMKNPEAVKRHTDKLLGPPVPLTTRLPRPSLCPTCGTFLSAATSANLDGSMPKPGDATVCMDCGALLTFTEDLALQVLDEGVLDPTARRMVKLAREVIAEKKAMEAKGHDR